MTRSILVIGAGIVGVCCALSLQKRGLAVTLIDRGSPGRETSYGNAGVLSRISITPLNNPGLYSKIQSYLGNKHAALHLNWSRVARSPEWLLRFLWEARSSQAQQRIEALNSLTATTVEMHRDLMAQAGISRHLRDNGTIKLWRGEAGHAAAKADHDFLMSRGIATEILDRQGISAYEPHLNPIFAAGLFVPANGSVDNPAAVVEGYAALFAARGGTILRGEVTALSRTGSRWQAVTASVSHEADAIVLALGPWSGDLLRPLGLDPKLDVERGYHFHMRPKGGTTLSRPVYDVDAAYFMAPMEQGLRVTSGVEIAHRDAPENHRQVTAALARAREAISAGETVEDKPWRGSRPTLPDSLPMIGEAPRHPGLWLAFGNQHIGLTTGPATGEVLAAMMTGEKPMADPTPFAPSRYIR